MQEKSMNTKERPIIFAVVAVWMNLKRIPKSILIKIDFNKIFNLIDIGFFFIVNQSF